VTSPEDLLPPKPTPPEPGECCGGGCARCVHDIYDELLERWERQVADIRARAESEKGRRP
jgi:hypothetical protein